MNNLFVKEFQTKKTNATENASVDNNEELRCDLHEGNQPEIVSHILCAIYSFNLSKRELSFEQGDIKDSTIIFVRK